MATKQKKNGDEVTDRADSKVLFPFFIFTCSFPAPFSPFEKELSTETTARTSKKQ